MTQNDRLCFSRQDKSDYTHMRVRKNQYDAIREISDMTGDSIVNITAKLLQFALEHVDIYD